MVCNHDCFNCTYDDCISNETTYEEYKQLDYYDYLIYLERRNNRQKSICKYNHSEKGKAAIERYRQTEKWKETKEQYEKSEKGKAAKARYEKSERGKSVKARYEKSEKGKATKARYEKSERGKALKKARQERYLKKKAEREAEKVSEI